MKKLVLSIMLGSTLLVPGKAAANKNVNIKDINMDCVLSDTIQITKNTKLSIDNIYREGTIEYIEFNNGLTLAHDYLNGEFYTVSNNIKVDRVICVTKNIDWILLSDNTIVTYDENNQSYYIESGNFLENV